jgi:putative membrane protein
LTDVPILNAVFYTAAGIVAFVVAFAILVKAAPFDVWREIAQERNVAAAILAGAVALGLCWIIAATMH